MDGQFEKLKVGIFNIYVMCVLYVCYVFLNHHC